MKTALPRLAIVILSFLAASAGFSQPNPAPVVQTDPEAERLLAAVAQKLASAQSLVVDAQFPRHAKDYANNRPDAPFRRNHEIAVQRPNLLRLERIFGVVAETRSVLRVADGKNLWVVNPDNFIGYKRPLRAENFHHSTSPVVQYFFNPKIEFDPTDPMWGQSLSVFSNNRQAYDRFVTTRYLGERDQLNERVQVVEVRFSTDALDVRQTYFIKDDTIRQLDTHFGSDLVCVKYRNYRFNDPIAPEQFAYVPPAKLPLQEADPVRLGELAPDFELPLNTGGTIKLSELLKDKKGLLVVTLNGAAGSTCQSPDYYLAQMKIMQTVRDKFKEQGLEVIALVGGTFITPDVKDEMLRNWLPDQTRFSYPIAVDVDLERGIQGSAYHSFHLNGRNNILLDAGGRVVFACNNFDHNRVNEIALYQALSQIGFAVSPVDLEIKR